MGLKKDAAEKGLEVATDLVKNNATNVLGMLFPYAGLKKKAVEMRMEQIEKSNLPDETKQFMVLNMRKDLKRLKNQNAIAEIAFREAKEGTDFSEKSGVDEEWFERYMDAAKFVSSEYMQLIWGKILAGEFERQGSTPPNMIRVLSEITPELAKAFRTICSMRVLIREIDVNGHLNDRGLVIVVPFCFNSEGFKKLGIPFMILNELDTLGVLKYSSEDLGTTLLSKKTLLCFENELEIVEQKVLPQGNVMLTAVGKALLKITEPVKIEGYHEMIKEYMIKKGVKFANIDDYIIEEKDGEMTVTKKNNP